MLSMFSWHHISIYRACLFHLNSFLVVPGLALKGIEYEYKPVHLNEDGGKQVLREGEFPFVPDREKVNF